MIMGDDLCSRGCGLKSRCHILNGHFFALICCKNCIVCLKRPKINEKEARVGPFKNSLEHLLIKMLYNVDLKQPSLQRCGSVLFLHAKWLSL